MKSKSRILLAVLILTAISLTTLRTFVNDITGRYSYTEPTMSPTPTYSADVTHIYRPTTVPTQSVQEKFEWRKAYELKGDSSKDTYKTTLIALEGKEYKINYKVKQTGENPKFQILAVDIHTGEQHPYVFWATKDGRVTRKNSEYPTSAEYMFYIFVEDVEWEMEVETFKNVL